MTSARRIRVILLTTSGAFVAAAALAAQAWQADRLTFSEPTVLATIDGGTLRGDPAMLAWAPDGSELYFQTIEGGFAKPGSTAHHYIISAVNGRVSDLGGEPEWAVAYWTAKNGQASPDDPAFRIELKSEQRTERTTNVPRGGDLARGGVTTAAGTSTDDSIANAITKQVVYMHSMLLHGELIGYFENTVIVPGLTFGWGPRGSKIIAYAAKNGRVVAMDAAGGMKEVPGSKDALLPAWSDDGTSLAWLEKDGRRRLLLRVSRVSGT